MEHNTLIYQSEDGGLRTEVTLQDDTLSSSETNCCNCLIKIFAPLMNTKIFFLKKNLKKSTIRDLRIVREEGKKRVARNIEHYNLEFIISLGIVLSLICCQ